MSHTDREPVVSFNVRIRQSVAHALTEKAKVEGESRASIVRRLLRSGLEQYGREAAHDLR